MDKLPAQALVSNEEWKRFDALALVSDFRVRSAVRSSMSWDTTETSRAPGAPFELRKVRQIIAELD